MQFACSGCGRIYVLAGQRLRNARAQILRGATNHYCSRACMGRARRAADIRCKTCGAEVHKTYASNRRMRRYCSRECYARAITLPPITFTCEWCRISITASGKDAKELRRPSRRFCSLACAGAARVVNMDRYAEHTTGRVLRALRYSKGRPGQRGPQRTKVRQGGR